MCDQGERGVHHDNFSGLLAGFTAKKLFCLGDLQGKNDCFFLDIDFPTAPSAPPFQMGHETAIRLCSFVAADLPTQR